jgi:hypothetical protein
VSKTSFLAEQTRKLADDVWALSKQLEPGRILSVSDQVRELKDISTNLHHQAFRLEKWH